MKRSEASDVLITGVGVTAAIGQGRDAFVEALLQGAHRFDVLSRPGRQLPSAAEAVGGIAPPPFIGAELPALAMPARVPRSMLRTASLSGQAALATLDEAWADAALDEAEPTRIGLIVGGSNLQQRESALATEPYRGRETFLRPNYGLSFMDSDLCGMCTEVFGIRAFAFTVGGASASGQVAAIQAMEAVRSGRVDLCIAIGALMDVSYWELQGLRSLGAMGSDRYAGTPAAACRPFDSGRDGFIYGESCAALVFERADTAALRRGVSPYARAAGWAMAMDGNRNPNPALEGEASAIRGALSMAQTAADRIDYVNPHGTGSHIGDITELQALSDCGAAPCAHPRHQIRDRPWLDRRRSGGIGRGGVANARRSAASLAQSGRPVRTGIRLGARRGANAPHRARPEHEHGVRRGQHRGLFASLLSARPRIASPTRTLKTHPSHASFR
jgi:malonyl-ACP decarboxylase